jgi:DNA-binding transcriptional regulator GbsR (MarR family)
MPRSVSRAELLTEAQDRFIAAWGQMGSAWGISRTMAEVYALLYITGEPLNTDDIMDRLRISRGNASMSLRALLDWGIVFRSHKRGDRKEYFQAEQDVWAMFRAIVRERMKREVDPLLASLYEIRDLVDRPARRARAAEAAPEVDRAAADHTRRLDAMVDFLATLESLSSRFISPSGPGLQLAADLLKSAS